MVTLQAGQRVTHKEHGEIKFEKIVEELTEVEFVVSESDTTFDGGSIGKVTVRYYVPVAGQYATESLSEFIENVDFSELE